MIQNKGSIGFFACAVLSFPLITFAADTLPPAADQVMLEYPGVRVYTHEGRVRALYGRPMTKAATPAESVSIRAAESTATLASCETGATAARTGI